MRGSQPHLGLPDPPAAPQVAHPLVQKQLVDYVHNGFLVPVMGPALHKVRVPGSRCGVGVCCPRHCPCGWAGPRGAQLPVLLLQTSVEEMIASTAYLDLFLRSVSETALLKTFLRFVLLHRHDNTTILDTLVGRINSNSRVSPMAPTASSVATPVPHIPILVFIASPISLPSCPSLSHPIPIPFPCPAMGWGALPPACSAAPLTPCPVPSCAWCP